MELLYTTLVLFVFIFPFFFVFKEFKLFKFFLIFFEWIVAVILLSDNFYKDQSLYEDQNFNWIQILDFYPIKSLKTKYYNGQLENISYDTMNISKFSLIKTNKYSTQCLENYYIKTNESCPITDIKLGNKNDKIYNNSIKINENEYIYYTNENKLGKLYKTFNYLDFKNNTIDAFSLDKLTRKELNKISNPIYDLKSYIKFCDIFCFLLIFFSFWCTLLESFPIKNCDISRIFNHCVQFIVLVLHIIRFIKFIDVKTFLFDNEDIYDIKDEDYFPNKVFNIDSFLLAVCINILVFNFLSVCFPNKPACCGPCDRCDINNSNDHVTIIFIFIVISLYITYFVLAIFDILNDEKIVDNYNNMIYNWEMNPIKSIEISYQNSSFLWKGNYFRTEKLKEFDYFNIFLNKDGKICGKDSYGNDLYFPNDVDCPINDIYISEKNEYKSGYKGIGLNNGRYLYYTNETFTGKIIIDFRISFDLKIPYNPEFEDDLPNIPFYEEIDSEGENSYLYSINYLGINTSSISGKKIKGFKHNIKVYKALSKGKLALFCLLNIFFILTIFFFILEERGYDSKNIFYILTIISRICLLIVYLLSIIFIIICLNNHVNYITNFMNKINLDFKREKNDFKWNLITLIYLILFVATPITVFFTYDCYEKYGNKGGETKVQVSNDDRITKLEEEIEKKDKEIKELKKKIEDIYINENNTNSKINNILTLKDNNSENERLKKELEEKQKQLDKANKKLIDNLDSINQKDKRIKILEDAIPFNIKEGDHLMCVIFQSFNNQAIHYPFLCTNKQVFTNLENLLYERIPEYKRTNNYFISNGKIIEKYLSLEENNIRDGDIICMNINDINE